MPEGGTACIGGAGDPEWEHTWEPALDVVSPEAYHGNPVRRDGHPRPPHWKVARRRSDTVFVDVLLELDIPSGFTPNTDGINDAWNRKVASISTRVLRSSSSTSGAMSCSPTGRRVGI